MMSAGIDPVQTLPNGLRLVQRVMADTQTVTVHVTVRVGGRDENLDTEYGSAHFLEHLLFKRTENYPKAHQLSEAIDTVGGYMNAYTTEELTSFFVKLPKDHFELGLKVLSDIVCRPLWNDEELEHERGVILEELNVFVDEPAQLVFDYVGGLLWPESSLRTTVYGTSESVQGLEAATITSFHDRFYVPGNAVVSIAGNVDAGVGRTLVERYFGSWAGAMPARTTQGLGEIAPQKVWHEPLATSQAHIVLAGRGCAIEDSDQVGLHYLAALLGSSFSSRLNRVIREEMGLAYHIFMHSSAFTDAGKWQIYAGVGAANLAESVQAIMKIVRDVCTSDLPGAELVKVREQLKSRLIMGQETNSAVADRLGFETSLLGQPRPLAERISEIEAVQASQVLAVAERYLQADQIRMAVIAPEDMVDKSALEALLS